MVVAAQVVEHLIKNRVQIKRVKKLLTLFHQKPFKNGRFCVEASEWHLKLKS